MSNAVSYDFPFRFKFEQFNPPPVKKEVLPKTNETHYYTNETPELFRLGTMKENPKGYKNPFLDEVINVDRNEAFKQMDYNRKQIDLIDKIKSNPKYSQDPKILRYIRSEFDVSMQEKRESILKERQSQKEDPRYKLCYEDDNELFDRKINQLHKEYGPKIPYRMKQKIDLSNLLPISSDYSIPKIDKERFIYLKSELKPWKSSYLGNLNDYNIKEADTPNLEKIVHFDMKDHVAYNLVKDKMDTIKPPYALNEKWDNFHENFVMLIDKDKGFQKKGGLFTEFSNKNKCVYDMQQQNRQVEMEKRKSISNGGFAVVSSDQKQCMTETNPLTKSSNNTSTIKQAKKSKYSINQVNNAIKVIEDNNLFKLKNMYMKTSPNL